MKWIYLPKPRERSFLFQKKGRFKGLFNRRRNNQSELYRLIRLILGLFILMIAIRLGSAFLFVLQQPLSYEAISYSDGITLPVSKTHEPISQARLAILVFIHKDGKIRIGSKEVENSERSTVLEKRLSLEPFSYPLLIVDQDAPMEYVNEVISDIRNSGFKKLKFATSKTSNKTF